MNDKKHFGKLDWIDPARIEVSEENPRNEDYYKDKDFLRLKESIAKYGVIVPIIIKQLSEAHDKRRYRLIDGERRWKAAIDTHQTRIPAYVLPPEKELDVLATMFQIHMNQEGWSPVEQTRALERIISTLKDNIRQRHKVEDETEKDLVHQLIEITGMDETTAWSRIRFFRWPQDLRECIYNEPTKNYYSYAVEIEAKIVEPALRNFPDIEKKIPRDDIRRALFAKVTEGYVSRAEEIREAAILAKRRSDKREASQAKNLLLRFIKDKAFTFPEAREHYLYLFPEEARKPPLSPRKLINSIRSLTKVLNEYTGTTIRNLKPPQKTELRNVLSELATIARSLIKELK